MITRNDPCWCNSGKKWKKCHYPQQQKNLYDPTAYKKNYNIILKTPEQIEGIRHACQITKNILDKLAAKASAGITTNELDQLSMQLHKEAQASPAPLGYGSPPFPKSICTSLNEVICHGIPNDEPLQEGDFLNIDVSAIVNGFYGDCSKMIAIGEIDSEKKRVMQTSKRCLDEAIKVLKPGLLLHVIGDVITKIAEEQHCSVVHQFVGHGVGLHFHEAPTVFHSKNNSNIPLAPGMIFTIEPMINAGKPEGIIDQNNQWVCYTIDKRPSAQFEHTVLITETGCEVLTQ